MVCDSVWRHGHNDEQGGPGVWPSRCSQFGINIRGRSHRLKINYRTTEQVLRWATRLLSGAEVDDLDGGTDNEVGYRSLYTGPERELHEAASPGDEARFVVERARALVADTPAEEIALDARARSRVGAWADSLSAAGLPCAVLDGDSDTTGPGILVATMHRVKGLDFTHVVMHMPAHGRAGSAHTRDPRDQSLLYVAATRCRKTLTVVVSP